MRNKLIINADDYGMSLLFNKGIIELAKKNKVSSISVMIKRKFVNIAGLNKLKNISLGLHLELKDKDTQKEIESQIYKFRFKLGKMPSHLDGHKHCHLTKGNFLKLIKTAQKYNLPVRSVAEKDRKNLRKFKIKTPDNFISWHPEREGMLISKLNHNKNKITELVCHLGYYDKKSKSSYNLQREKELKILKSREFKKTISRYKLINYYEI